MPAGLCSFPREGLAELSRRQAESTDDTRAAGRDGRLTLATRLAFTPLAVITAIFGPLLVLLPGDTAEYWSWSISPDMSAVWVGAGYTFGAIAITTMLLIGRSGASLVAIGGTWPFSVVMLAATVTHNDRFFTGSAGYFVWLAIYVILPFALPVLLRLEMQHDRGRQAGDVLLPPWLRWAFAGAGVVVTLIGLVLVVDTTILDNSWPWLLTPLMSRVIGGWLLFIGAGGLAALVESRYIAYRFYLLAATVWFSVLFAASLLNGNDFDSGRLATPLFFVMVAGAAMGVAGAFLYMERLVRARSA